MKKLGEAIREHHQALLHTILLQVAALEAGRPDADPTALVHLLTTDLLPHTLGEERHIYPVIDDLLRRFSRPTAPMSIDHQYIERYIQEIEQIAGQLDGASAEEEERARSRMAVVGRELVTLLKVHMDKEEKVFLPLIEGHLSGGEQKKILTGIHDPYAEKG